MSVIVTKKKNVLVPSDTESNPKRSKANKYSLDEILKEAAGKKGLAKQVSVGRWLPHYSMPSKPFHHGGKNK